MPKRSLDDRLIRLFAAFHSNDIVFIFAYNYSEIQMCGLRIGYLVLCLYTSLMNGLNSFLLLSGLIVTSCFASLCIGMDCIALRCHSRVGVRFIRFEINSFTFKYSTSRRLMIKLRFVFSSIAFAFVCSCIHKYPQNVSIICCGVTIWFLNS